MVDVSNEGRYLELFLCMLLFVCLPHLYGPLSFYLLQGFFFPLPQFVFFLFLFLFSGLLSQFDRVGFLFLFCRLFGLSFLGAQHLLYVLIGVFGVAFGVFRIGGLLVSITLVVSTRFRGFFLRGFFFLGWNLQEGAKVFF